MSLSVVTLTRFDRPQWLDECRASVARQLPPGAHHLVSECLGDFQEARWRTTLAGGEFVAWVDDDDRVANDALPLCLQALRETGAGVAFTHQARIDEHGAVIAAPRHQRTLRDVAMHPLSLHHLAMIRVECLSPEVYEHAARIGIGIDWLMRAWCALRYGAVQVPIVGYEWRLHATAESQSPGWTRAYEEAMPALRDVTTTWMTRDAPIDRFLPR